VICCQGVHGIAPLGLSRKKQQLSMVSKLLMSSLLVELAGYRKTRKSTCSKVNLGVPHVLPEPCLPICSVLTCVKLAALWWMNQIDLRSS
jgi:hypothetical protein